MTAEYPYVFPPLAFFQKASMADSFVLADTFAFPKREKINRYHVLGLSGCVRLTVPLQRCSHRGPVADAKIAPGDPDWRPKHWKTLTNLYRAAPFFEYYAEELRYLLFQQSSSFLELAESTARWCAAKLGLQAEFRRLSEFAPGLKGDGALLRAAKVLGADEYIQLVGDRDVGNRRRFDEAGVRVRTVAVKPVRYHTLSQAPCERVSTLDLLVNEGPEAGRKLRESMVHDRPRSV